MKLKQIFVTETLGQHIMYISIDKSVYTGIIRANYTADFIMKLLTEDNGIDEIVCIVQKKYGLEYNQAYQCVSSLIQKLDAEGLIEK